ncbi:MAG TPA: molybdopterin-dependent oxidoreductase [Caldilineae bacterium]|nr:molybdopterin-dependent oxidoreductase [Caldilineae bacterium]
MAKLEMIVNGDPVRLDVPPQRTLAEVLRYDLGLTGTKIGCGEAECGACTVLVNGEPVLSCVFPALKAQGARVLTIEGLAPDPDRGAEGLHPLQRAFIETGAVQCGFCTPGVIMAAFHLLMHNPDPTDDEIKHALKDTYCRCTGYAAIIRAIKLAAAEMRGEAQGPAASSVLTWLPSTRPPLRVVGRAVPRPDAVGKVTGRLKFADDISFPDMLHGRVLRSAHPHARIRRIDTSKAKALPGVVAVLTHADVPGRNRHGLIYEDWPVLCEDKVRYVGDAIALVAAETRDIATRALELIEVAYEPLPVVSDPVQARRPDAPLVHEEWPTGNLLKHIHVERGDVEAGFAEADIVIEREYRTPFYDHVFLEPECSIGVPAGYPGHDKLTVYVGSQIPYKDREQIAAALGLDPEDVRVIGTPIGGGFGGKEDIAGQIHAALLAQATGRPVKILFDRAESLRVHPKRHATIIRVKVGARRDGRLVAVQAELYGDTGAYASLGDKVMTRATTHAAGPYDVPNVKIDCYAMYTNNPPAGAFRGFGVTQSAFAIESTMDILARELGMDPFELRRINALRVGSITNTGQVLRESVGLLECLDRVEKAVQEEMRRGSGAGTMASLPARRGWGLAVAYKNTGLGGGAPDKAGAEVEVFPDGTAEVRTSSADMGQGLMTVVAQIAAEELGLPFERVRVLLSDTDRTPDGGPTTASRQTYVTGNAVRHAARLLRERLARVAAERLDVAPDRLRFADGAVYVDEANEPLASLAEVTRWAQEEGHETRIRYEYEAPRTQPLGTGGDMHFAYSYACQAALVEVNTETGEVRVLKVISAHDVGRAINPVGLLGQIEGGIVMGLGSALTEQYIVENGVPWTRRLGQYKMPSIVHMPEMISFIVEQETADGPYGAKGVGELASIPTAAAITNAIYDAIGVRVCELPVDQDALLRALRAGKRELMAGWSRVR